MEPHSALLSLHRVFIEPLYSPYRAYSNWLLFQRFSFQRLPLRQTVLAREEEEKQEEEQEQVRLLHLWTFLLILAFSIFCMWSEGRHGICSIMMGQSTGNRDQTPRDGRPLA